jgi:beta-glucosidase
VITKLVALLSSLLSAGGPRSASAPPAAVSSDARVEDLLRQLSLEEKVDLLGGVDGFSIRGVPRLGVPRINLADGPMGVVNGGPATAYPGGVALAATWQPTLAESLGRELGREARAKGFHVLLAPGVNLQRLPVSGRGFEYFGEDPTLAARMAVGFIRGVQAQGVCATVKHFMGNSSEVDRNGTDSRIGERAKRELYLPAFEAAVKEAQVGAVMAAYNLVDGEWMSQNHRLDQEVLKGEWGFDGILMSDWVSTYDGLAAARAGLDLEMPSGAHLNRESLLPALRDGRLPVALIDDKVRRILRVAARFGWLDRSGPEPALPRYNRAGRAVALQIARESVVLLKNEREVLPLDGGHLKSVLVVGPGAHPAVLGGGGSSQVTPFTAVSLLEGLASSPLTTAAVLWDPGIPRPAELVAATTLYTEASGGERGLRAEYFAGDGLEGAPMLTRVEPRLDVGGRDRPRYPEGARSERWSGYFVAEAEGAYDFTVGTIGDGGGHYRLTVDGVVVIDRWDREGAVLDTVARQLTAGPHAVRVEHHRRCKWPADRLDLSISRRGSRVSQRARELASAADAVVVAVGFDPGAETEGADRSFTLPVGQEELILTMAAANARTVVVVNSGSSYATESWLGSVPALLQAWYPGQEGGVALAEILLGGVNPSGRLPVSFERHLEDNPSYASYAPAGGDRRIEYREDLFAGYRGFLRPGATPPLFAFGAGLSYTSFAYARLALEPGGDGHVRVSFNVKNTGRRAGADVAQLYVSSPHAQVPVPVRTLRGFVKLELQPGQSRRVSADLDPRAFSYFDVTSGSWQPLGGPFLVAVGRSAEAVVLEGTVALDGSR